MTDIFLSYSREDQVVARRFAGGFEREGLSVWWDQSLTPGEAFDQVTERALGEARAVVVLWSKASVNSRWVRAEATQANADHRLVPVMIEHCKRPIMFELTHTADLSDWQGNEDDPEWQSFVANVRQFVQGVAPVASPVVRAPRRSGPSLLEQAVKALRRLLRFGAGIVFVLIGAAIAGGIVWKLRPPGDREITRFSVEVPATLGSETVVAVSPDGRRIVYVVGKQLYSRRLDQDEPTQIPGADDAHDPFFSPDGKAVAFFTATQLKAFEFSSEAVRVIADVKPAAGLVGAWSPEGRIYFGLGGAFGLSWVPAVGGEPESFAALSDYNDLDYPDVLPGGKWMLFSANLTSGDWSGSDIVAQNVATGERKVVLKGGHFARYLPTGHLVFVRNGTLYAVAFDATRVATRGRVVPVVQGVSSSETSGHAAYAVSANGNLVYLPGAPSKQGREVSVVSVSRTGESSAMSLDQRVYSNPRASPDGSRIAIEVAGADKSVHIWVMDATKGTAAQLTFEGEDRFPVWTADGREILFTSRRGKEFSIFRKAADGSGDARRVLVGTKDLAPSDTRGHTLVFADVGNGGARDIMTLDLDTAGPAKPLIATPADESGGRVSPDGTWIAYSSTVVGSASQEPRILVRPFRNAAEGGQRAISEDSGFSPAWSPKGDEIFYIQYKNAGPSTLESMPVTMTPTTITPAGTRELFQFFPRFDVTTPGTLHATPFDVLPKGRFVAVDVSAPKRPEGAEAITERPHLNVVLNWAEELRQLAPAQ